MAKHLTRDRYKIHAETSVEEMGAVLATLTKMGLENIGYELITDVRSFGHNKTHETSAEQEMTEYIKEHPTFAIADAITYLKAQGRTSGAVYTAVRIMVEKRVLKRLEKGNYQRADIKAIAPPKTMKKTARVKRKQFETAGMDVIWRHIRNRSKFTTQELRALFRSQGRKENSVSPILTALTQAKQVKQTTKGEYRVLKKAVPVKKVMKIHPPSPTPSLNGPIEGEASEG